MESNNILYEPLPEEWNGYKVNTWFQVGIQVSIMNDDDSLSDYEKSQSLLWLLFGDEDADGNEFRREYPQGEDFKECVTWFLNGWCHDKSPKQKDRQKVMDYYIDQYRIYADFRQIYGINLNEADMHWWEFCGLLWNMPYKQSSFLRVIEIRTKKIRKGMSKEEKEATKEAQETYSLEQKKSVEYTEEQEQKIDEYDRMMELARKKAEEKEKIIEQFGKR